LPPYARRSKSLEVLIPILYLKGVSTGDFEEALVALLGKDAGGLSGSRLRSHGCWRGVRQFACSPAAAMTGPIAIPRLPCEEINATADA
jgi:hypothetical protein